MANPEVASLVKDAIVHHGRKRGLKSFLRGWQMNTGSLFTDEAAVSAVVTELTGRVTRGSTLVIGIERGGVPLATELANTLASRGIVAHLSTLNVRAGCSSALSSAAAGVSQVLLVDDIVNSGLTAGSALRVLASGGVRPDAFLALVKYPRGCPPALRKWGIPVEVVCELSDLGLTRFGALPAPSPSDSNGICEHGGPGASEEPWAERNRACLACGLRPYERRNRANEDAPPHNANSERSDCEADDRG